MEGEAILKDYRKAAVILFFWLGILTIIACLQYDPQGPFDARDYTRIAGMRLEQHGWEPLIEPFAAPFMILGGAPDFQVACVSVFVWLLVGTAAWGIFAEFRAQGREKPFAIASFPSIVIGGMRRALAAYLTLALLIFLFVVGRIPGWRLVVDDPDLIVADLHCHTTKSHDAVVSLETNLKWHASCGYNLVALTEHDQLFAHDDSSTADSSFDRLPAFLSGVEAHTGLRAVLLGICRDPHMPLERQKADEWPDRTAWFSKKIHEDCGGAVIALTLKRLAAGDIARLADDGVDGFEIVNSGHPEMRPDLRREVLETCLSRGLPLVATTDWHGWTGLAKTWTVIRAPGASLLTRSQRADLVVRKLREHDSEDIIPVVAGHMGDPSLVRAIFSPVAETVRYAEELSAARVTSWWVWVCGLFALWVFFDRKALPAGGILLAWLASVTGLGLIVSGLWFIKEGIGSAAAYPIHIGSITVALGALALGCGIFQNYRTYRTYMAYRNQ
ncbi:MAG TPA: hypothetical protein VEF34_19130 [Syntrophobacteraceae bacterium]|nr:hypothetical protein [Syntrophobacteraceae bacterium]